MGQLQAHALQTTYVAAHSIRSRHVRAVGSHFRERLDHFHPTLENFEDMINWSLSQPMSDANAHDVIEPAISIR